MVLSTSLIEENAEFRFFQLFGLEVVVDFVNSLP